MCVCVCVCVCVRARARAMSIGFLLFFWNKMKWIVLKIKMLNTVINTHTHMHTEKMMLFARTHWHTCARTMRTYLLYAHMNTRTYNYIYTYTKKHTRVSADLTLKLIRVRVCMTHTYTCPQNVSYPPVKAVASVLYSVSDRERTACSVQMHNTIRPDFLRRDGLWCSVSYHTVMKMQEQIALFLIKAAKTRQITDLE